MKLFTNLLSAICMVFIATSSFACEGDSRYYISKEGCKVWGECPQPDESVSWSGKCVDGYATGVGVVTWAYQGNRWQKTKQELRQGKAVAQFWLKDNSGFEIEYQIINGSPTKLFKSYKNSKGTNIQFEGKRGKGVKYNLGDNVHVVGEFVQVLDDDTGNYIFLVDGKATCYNEDGEVFFTGIMKNNKFYKGKQTWPDGDTFEGDFDEYGMPKGFTQKGAQDVAEMLHGALGGSSSNTPSGGGRRDLRDEGISREQFCRAWRKDCDKNCVNQPSDDNGIGEKSFLHTSQERCGQYCRESENWCNSDGMENTRNRFYCNAACASAPDEGECWDECMRQFD